MAAGLSFAVKAATLLPRTGISATTKVLAQPIIWRALTKGAADGVAYGDATITLEDQLELTVDVNEARLATTAAIGGTIFLGTQLWFYEQLKMRARVIEAARLLDEVKEVSTLIETALTSKNKTTLSANALKLEELGQALIAINNGVDDLDSTLIPIANNLFEIDNLMGISETADDIVLTGSKLLKGETSLKTVQTLLPKVQSLYTAAEASSKAAGTASFVGRTAKVAGVVGGKVILVDTVIWGVTLGLDLGLNFFMTEEEQMNIPIVGFLFKGAGWSPIGAALEWVIVNTVELFIGEETAQTLYEVFIAMIIAASQVPTLEEVFELILGFYVDEISAELLVDLTFSTPELTFNGVNFNLLSQIIKGDPLIILEVFVYAIILKLVFTRWIQPIYRYSLKGATA